MSNQTKVARKVSNQRQDEARRQHEVPARRAWTRPDFTDYDTPMEVTAYAARA